MVPVPGMTGMASVVDTGGVRMDQGREFQFPQVFLDPVLRTVVISGRHYPLERVVCFERAKAALSKMPERPKTADYTIGKRNPKDV